MNSFVWTIFSCALSGSLKYIRGNKVIYLDSCTDHDSDGSQENFKQALTYSRKLIPNSTHLSQLVDQHVDRFIQSLVQSKYF